MKKHLLLLLTTLLAINSYSQVLFEKGYYIDNSDQKIDCLIKNVEWKNNPTEFEYKLAENSDGKKKTIKAVKEFGVYNISKYISSKVKIDRSSENINKLSYDRNPIFKEEQLFLKVLVEGKSSLYEYVDRSLTRYFYSKENSAIEQLIFKSYKTFKNQVGKNNRYKQQLWDDLKCSTFTMNKVENLDYHKNELVSFFVEYNQCNNQEFINFEKKQKKNLFNLTLRPRINSSSLKIQNSISNSFDTDFGNILGFGFGIEAEYIFPFNKNKWAISIEPTYQSIKSEKITDKSNAIGLKLISKVKYNSIEIPLSLRHYLFLNNNSKFFINASFILNYDLNYSVEFERRDDFASASSRLEIDSRHNLAFGLGYKHNDRYSLELRYETSQDLFDSYRFWKSNYNGLSLIFGYTIF